MTAAVTPPQAPVEAPPPPEQPAGPQFVGVEATNKLPPEQLTQAFTSGQLGFHADERVPVRLASGEIGTVAAAQASDVVNAGGEIIPHAVVEHARLAKEYGGAGGTFGAGIAGAFRSASLGVSDPIAIAAAEAVGGEQGAAKMRERLSAYKEIHPVASAVGEVAGIVAPAMLGDEAGLASVIGKPMALTTSLGEGAAKLIPEIGEGLLGRVATGALREGTSQAVQGAIFGLGQEVSESALGNEQLTGEKLLASLGHGAVLGGLLGGALGGAGEVASDVIELAKARASPYLSKAAGTQMWKALDASPNVMKEAEKRFEGGAAGVGRTLLDLDVLPKDAGLAGAALTPAELLPRVTAKLDEVGGQIGKIIDESGGTVAMKTLDEQIEQVIGPLRGKAGFKPIVKAVEDYRNDLFEKLGAVTDEGKVAAGIAKPMLEIPPHLEAARPQIEKLAEAAARGEAEAMQTLDGMGVKRAVQSSVPETDILNREVPVSALFAQKRALGDLVYKEVKALDPSMRVEQLRAIYGKLSDLELDAVEQAAKEMSGPGKAELLAARKNYQALSLAKKGLDGSVAKAAQNSTLGMPEYMAGVMPGMTALLSGHPAGAVIGAASAVATRFARARGNAFLAATVDRLSALKTLANRSADLDKDIGSGVKAFVDRAKGGAGKDLGAIGSKERPTGETAREEFMRWASQVEAGANVDHAEAISTLAPHAPLVSASFKNAATRATLWLASQVPPNPPIGSRTPSDQAIQAFNMKARAVSNPVGTILGGMARGNLSPIETSAIRDCGAYPALMADIQQKIATEVKRTLDRGTNLPYPVRRDLALLFNVPDWSMSPEGVRTLQANTLPPPGGAGGGKGKPGGGPAPKRPVPYHAGQDQSSSERLQVGQIRES